MGSVNNLASAKIKLGISSCLLGQSVRHDGGHKRHSYTVNTLSGYFEFVSFCPEVMSGLGTPRPTIRLVDQQDAIRLVEVKNRNVDVTDKLLETSSLITEQAFGLAGYIVKKDSPSCGMERVRVYDQNDVPRRTGQGVFAYTLMKAYPNMPVEEEGRLMDAVLRENFLQRVYVYDRWLKAAKQGMTANGLVEFHTQHKFILLAHDEAVYRELGPIVAKAGSNDMETLAEAYISKFMSALKKPATRKRHTNVLMHVSGFLKKRLTPDEKTELNEILDQYRSGIVPLVVPLTLLKHHFRRFPNSYIKTQRYIDPYPEALMLRNSV